MERKILLISGRPPMHSAGFVQDTINLLEQAGSKVDFMTLYDFEGQKENHFNVFRKPLRLKLIELLTKHPWLRMLRCIYHWPYLLLAKIFVQNRSLTHGDFLLVFEKEEEPPIDPDLIFNKVREDYDYFAILIVQDMLTSKTIQMLYDKYQKPMIIMVPDMYFLAGNCFFPNDCKNYRDECRNCPAYKEIGIEDSAHNNFTYKKHVFENIRCAIPCNTHVAKFAEQSKIIQQEKLFISSFILDVDKFKPCDNELSKKRFNISAEKSLIIMMRYIGPHNHDWKRKGGIYLLETLDKLYNKMSKQERDKCLLLFVGTEKVDSELNLKFETMCTGNLCTEDLILAYNASSVFFCPSINDSGPSMVNQAMACSTPVIAFNQGTAIDVIENELNGFKAELYDTDTLSEAFVKILRMGCAQYQNLKSNARKKAIECNSFKAGVDLYKRIFDSFESGVL